MYTAPVPDDGAAERKDPCCAHVDLGLDPKEVEKLSREVKALAHPVRLQILHILAQYPGQVCVCDLEAALPVKQATISHHLRILRQAGLVDVVSKGVWNYWFVNQERLARLRTRITIYMDTLRRPADASHGKGGTT